MANMNVARETLAALSSYEEILCVAEQGWRGPVSDDVIVQYGGVQGGREALRREAANWVAEVNAAE